MGSGRRRVHTSAADTADGFRRWVSFSGRQWQRAAAGTADGHFNCYNPRSMLVHADVCAPAPR